MTRMPGVSTETASLHGDTRRETLKALGRMLRRIHSIPQEPLHRSGLFFGDQSPVDVRWRIGELFDSLSEMIRKRGIDWQYPLSPDEIGRHMMHTLPDTWDIVGLHSNPGPEHVFVDTEAGSLVGIIDFGDAYFSHPANDLRRWLSPDDRSALLSGYRENAPLDETFDAIW